MLNGDSTANREACASSADPVRHRKGKLKWLFLAHTDEVMLDLLSDAIDESTSAVVPVRQTEWDFNDRQLLEPIMVAIEEAGVQHIALVGHSEAYGNPADPKEDKGVESENVGSSAPFADSRRTQQQIAAAKSDLVTQLEKLAEVPRVKSAVRSNQLRVHALVYLAQSGSFLTYDSAQKLFFPLE